MRLSLVIVLAVAIAVAVYVATRPDDDTRPREAGAATLVGDSLNVGIEPYLGDDQEFLATYGDGLTDAPLPEVIDSFRDSGKTAMFLSVHPQFNAHVVSTDPEGNVDAVEDLSRSDIRINGGFFVLKRRILDLIEPGHELVEETFARLIEERELVAFPYEGFFGPMDTIKDRQRLDNLNESGDPPWRRITPATVPT